MTVHTHGQIVRMHGVSDSYYSALGPQQPSLLNHGRDQPIHYYVNSSITSSATWHAGATVMHVASVTPVVQAVTSFNGPRASHAGQADMLHHCRVVCYVESGLLETFRGSADTLSTPSTFYVILSKRTLVLSHPQYMILHPVPN